MKHNQLTAYTKLHIVEEIKFDFKALIDNNN